MNMTIFWFYSIQRNIFIIKLCCWYAI